MRYEEVFLYADDNGVLKKCLLDGYAAGVCVCVATQCPQLATIIELPNSPALVQES